MGSVAVLETSPTRKTLTQQQAIEREFGGPQSKALVTLYKPVYCRFCIVLLEAISWDWLKNDSFAINNANAPYTTTSQPFSNPRAPFESSCYALWSGVLSFWYLYFERRKSTISKNGQIDGPINRVKPHNNQPSSKQVKDTIRKPFLGSTSRWIVVVVSWSFKKFKGVKWNGQCRRVGNMANTEDTYATTSHRTRAWRTGIQSACHALQAGVLSLLYIFTGRNSIGSIEKQQFRHR